MTSETSVQENAHLSSTLITPNSQAQQPLTQNVPVRTISSGSASTDYQRHYVGVENVASYVLQESRTSAESNANTPMARRNKETHALMTELNETFGKKAGQALRKAVSRTPTVSITENSTPEEVSLWLQKKGFSPRVTEILEGQDGANLFALNKNSLIQACGREEGTRLYSQLLVQKRQSNYRTHSSAELNAILNYRRMHVEVTNEAPANEPATIVGE